MDVSLDSEWTKFMARLNRQQNCEDCDDDDDDSESDMNNREREHKHNQCNDDASPGIKQHVAAGGESQTSEIKSVPATVKQKRSCISKKQQRKSYSFVDDLSGDAQAPARAPAPAPATTTTTTSMTMDCATPTGLRVPASTPIYISTKTKIAYLTKPVDIYKLFWDVPVQHYYKRHEGVIKKQIKFQTTDPAVVAGIKDKLQQQPRCYEEHIIEHIDNPTGRIPFKDQRKISIGLCKKDLLGGNHKKKRAFFNCFVLILRINGGRCENPEERAPEDDVLYKEMHVKVFNTGKLEIPGIQEDKTLVQVLDLLVATLRPLLGDDLSYLKDRCETALINSNFNCGFFIDRDKLFHLMKYKYRINTNYDSCSYPGIQCKFYYIPNKEEQTGQQPVHFEDNNYYEVSFMIFRTGSILIVGKCNEDILNIIYRFIKKILEAEFAGIQMGLVVQKGGVCVPPIANDAEGLDDDGAGADGGAAGGGTLGKSCVRTIRKKKLYMTNITYYVETDD
jgi:hypothetical protein